MSGADDNGLPIAPEGAETTETGIVPVDSARVPQDAIAGMGLLWCISAGIFSLGAPALSAAFGAYGFLLVTVGRGLHDAPKAGLVALAAALVTGAFLGVEAVSSALVVLAIAFVMGVGLGSANLDSAGICLMCAAATLAFLGIDAGLAALAGENLSSLAAAQIEATFSSLTAGMTGVSEGLSAARELMRMFWPTSYTLHAILCVVAAGIGARVARTRLGDLAPREFTFTRFDPPLWVAGLLLVSIVGLALSQVVPAEDAVLMVSANLMMAVRFAFGTEGVAFVAWILRRRGTGIVATLVISAILVFIDMQFFVMAIVGLIDFWANFRHLSRGVKAPCATV